MLHRLILNVAAKPDKSPRLFEFRCDMKKFRLPAVLIFTLGPWLGSLMDSRQGDVKPFSAAQFPSSQPSIETERPSMLVHELLKVKSTHCLLRFVPPTPARSFKVPAMMVAITPIAANAA